MKRSEMVQRLENVIRSHVFVDKGQNELKIYDNSISCILQELEDLGMLPPFIPARWGSHNNYKWENEDE